MLLPRLGSVALVAGLLGAAVLVGSAAPEVDEHAPHLLQDLPGTPRLDPLGVLPSGPTVEHVARVPHGSGSGLWIHEGFAYSSGQNSGFWVTDVRDPGKPVKLASLTGTYMRDVDVLETQGRTIAVTAGNGAGMRFVDVTDPARPRLVGNIDVGITHNLAAVPGTTLVYGSRGGTGNEDGLHLDIIDGADPARPVHVKTWVAQVDPLGLPIQGPSCHDITVDARVGRAYCAGGRQSFVLDIADPLNPRVLSAITNPFITFHHWAVPSPDHQLLFLGDEYGGTLFPGCIASATVPVATASLPTGAVWIYDISDPATPLLLSWVSPPLNIGGSPIPCTAHFGDFVGEAPVLAVGWYQAGILLLDFSNPLLPRFTDQWAVDGVNAWDVRYWDGHLFTGDIARGMDVLRVVD